MAAFTCSGLAAGLPKADHGPAQQTDGGILGNLLAYRAHALVVKLEEKQTVNSNEYYQVKKNLKKPGKMSTFES